MPDVTDLRAAIEGLRRDRLQLARLAHRHDVSSGWLLVQGTKADYVLDLGRLAYIQARGGAIHFVLTDGSEVVGNSHYSIPGLVGELAAHPQLVRTHDQYIVNLHQVRGIGPAREARLGRMLYLATGGVELPLAKQYAHAVEAFFQLPRLDHVVPWNDRYQALIVENIRDFEGDIRAMSVEELTREFCYATTGEIKIRELIANLIWQYYTWMFLPPDDHRYRPPVDGNIRTFWYYIKPALSRLPGFDPMHQYEIMLDVFNTLVATRRLFHYRDFSFAEENAAWRRVGKLYPHIILVAEKTGHFPRIARLQETYGFTIMALKGQPSLLAMEFLCEELGAIVDLDTTPIRLINLIDYDPSGEIITQSYTKDLLRFGVKSFTRADIVLPSRFAPADLPAQVYQLPMRTKGDITKAKKWVNELHRGVDGQFLGIECEAIIFAGRMLEEIVAKLFEEARRPVPPGLQTEAEGLERWGLPDYFSAELLEQDPEGFWESWAENLAATGRKTG